MYIMISGFGSSLAFQLKCVTSLIHLKLVGLDAVVGCSWKEAEFLMIFKNVPIINLCGMNVYVYKLWNVLSSNVKMNTLKLFQVRVRNCIFLTTLGNIIGYR